MFRSTEPFAGEDVRTSVKPRISEGASEQALSGKRTSQPEFVTPEARRFACSSERRPSPQQGGSPAPSHLSSRRLRGLSRDPLAASLERVPRDLSSIADARPLLDGRAAVRGADHRMDHPRLQVRGRRRVRCVDVVAVGRAARYRRPLPPRLDGPAVGADRGGGVRLPASRLLGNDRAARALRRVAPVMFSALSTAGCDE